MMCSTCPGRSRVKWRSVKERVIPLGNHRGCRNRYPSPYASKGLSLETHVPADLALVYCDRTRIREVLLNLLSNAGRFYPAGRGPGGGRARKMA